IMDISARAISLSAGLNGPVGSPVFARAGKADPPSRLILSQTSVGGDGSKGKTCVHVLLCPAIARQGAPANVAFGSISPFSRCPRVVRSTPNIHRESGHRG